MKNKFIKVRLSKYGGDLPKAQTGIDDWVQRAANANLNFWEKCRLATSANNGSGSFVQTGDAPKQKMYTSPYEELADLKGGFFDKEQMKNIKRTLPQGVSMDDWVGFNREAGRLNVKFSNPDYSKYTDSTGMLKPEWQSVATNFDPYYLYYRPAFANKNSVSAEDIMKFYQSQPGGISNFKLLVNNGYRMPQRKHGGPIVDSRGQWAHPGKVTRIPSSNITMKGVPYPVLGVGDNGQSQMMYPGMDYDFGGASYVDEYPIMQRGGSPLQYQSLGQVRPTTADSLAIYNYAIAQDDYYKKNIEPYAKKTITPYIQNYPKIIEGLKKTNLLDTNLPENQKKLVRDNKNPNIVYGIGMLNSFNDYSKELLNKADVRIKPQKVIQYDLEYPQIDPNDGQANAYDIKAIADRNKPQEYMELPNLDQSTLDLILGRNKTIKHKIGDYKGNYDKVIKKIKKTNPNVNIEDVVKEVDRFEKGRKAMPGWLTGRVYYDPLAVKPYNMRTPQEKIEWEKKYGKPKPQSKPVVKPVVKPELVVVQDQIVADQQPVAPIQSTIPPAYIMRGNTPIYGPSNSFIGMMNQKSGEFYPDYMNTAGRANVNQADTDMMNNQQKMLEYLRMKGVNNVQVMPQKKQGGQTSDDREMLEGVADMLRRVKDPKNRKDIANYMMGNFRDEDVTFEPKDFLQDANVFKSGGEMIRRADGSYSRRGLWDNIRANRGSGKEPTKEMLEQERKIKGSMQNGGEKFSPNDTRLVPQFVAPAPGTFKIPTTDVERYAAQKSRELPQTIISTPKGQSISSKALSIAAHPMTAISYLSKGQRIPDNLEKGSLNIYDYATPVLNPASSLYSGVQIPGNLKKGEYLQAGLNTIGLLPGLKGLSRSIKSPGFNYAKGLIKQGNYTDAAFLSALASANTVAPIVTKIPGLKKLYKDLAYRIASSNQGTSSITSSDIIKSFISPKSNYAGSLSNDAIPERDLLKEYIYGNQSGFEKIDLKPFGLDKYFDKYGNMNVYKLRSRVPHGKEIINFADEGHVFPFDDKGVMYMSTEDNKFVKPLDDIAGHNIRITKTDVPDEYNLTTQDIWKFDADDYAKRWATSADPSRNYSTYLQAKLLERAGKPFILMQENPLKVFQQATKNNVNLNKKFQYGGGRINKAQMGLSQKPIYDAIPNPNINNYKNLVPLEVRKKIELEKEIEKARNNQIRVVVSKSPLSKEEALNQYNKRIAEEKRKSVFQNSPLAQTIQLGSPNGYSPIAGEASEQLMNMTPPMAASRLIKTATNFSDNPYGIGMGQGYLNNALGALGVVGDIADVGPIVSPIIKTAAGNTRNYILANALANQLKYSKPKFIKEVPTLPKRIDPIERSSVNVRNDIFNPEDVDQYENVLRLIYNNPSYKNKFDYPLIEFKGSRPSSFVQNIGSTPGSQESMRFKEKFCLPGSECAKSANSVTNRMFTDITGKPFDVLENAHNAWHMEDQMTRHGGVRVNMGKVKVGDRILMGNEVDQSTYFPGYTADPSVRHAGVFAGLYPTEEGVIPMIFESGQNNGMFLNPINHTFTGENSALKAIRPKQFLNDDFGVGLVDKNLRYAFRDKPSVATYSSSNKKVQGLLTEAEKYRETIKRTHDLTNDEFDELLNSLISIGGQETKLNGALPGSKLSKAKIILQNRLNEQGMLKPIKQTINTAKKILNTTAKNNNLPNYPGASKLEMEAAIYANENNLPFEDALNVIRSNYKPKPKYFISTAEPSKGMFRQKFQTELDRLANFGNNIMGNNALQNGLGQMSVNYNAIKKAYPQATPRQLIDLTTLAWNSPGKAMNNELVDFYLFGKNNPNPSKFNFDYINKVNKFKDKYLDVKPRLVDRHMELFRNGNYPEIQYRTGGQYSNYKKFKK